MPRLTRYFIKTALVYLALSLTLGVVLAARPALALPDELAAFSPVFFHLFMVGWVTQLIFGMLFWMLPKYSRELPRGHEKVEKFVSGGAQIADSPARGQRGVRLPRPPRGPRLGAAPEPE